jgi:hypothetical protein
MGLVLVYLNMVCSWARVRSWHGALGYFAWRSIRFMVHRHGASDSLWTCQGDQQADTLASLYSWDARSCIYLVSSDMHSSAAASAHQYSKLLGQGPGVLTRADKTDQAFGVPLSNLQMLYQARDTSNVL